MDAQTRFGMVLEASTLNAADSFLRQVQLPDSAARTGAAALVADPAAREQFVQAVDVFVDAPQYYLIASEREPAQQTPVGDLIASTAVRLPEAGMSAPQDAADLSAS